MHANQQSSFRGFDLVSNVPVVPATVMSVNNSLSIIVLLYVLI